MAGGRILEALCAPMTVSVLWDRLRARDRARSGTPINYTTFVLGLDWPCILAAVDLRGDALVQTESSPGDNPPGQP